MSKNIKIYTCHHKNVPTYRSECIIPIHAGKANSKIDLGIIGDDTGENISRKNTSWCELTVIYWMWKNIDADYYGLFHYRRFLNFNSLGGGYNIFNGFDLDTVKEFGWDDNKIRSVCEKFDIISSPIWNIHPVGLPNYVMTNYDFYAKEHFSEDLDIVINLIKEKTPDIYPYALKSLYSKECFFANMLIMKKEYFHNYCNWIFDILFEAEKLIDISSYDPYQKRIWGFIAERLSNCYLEYVRSKDENLRYTSLGMVFGIFNDKKFSKEDIEKNILANRETSQNLISIDTINIVFAIDNNYAIHCAGAIKSILYNANKEQKFKFFIVCDKDFSEINKALLKNYENIYINVEFLSVKAKDFSFYPLNREHISIATYYRLALHKILPENVSKVIYLDSDLVVVDNIVKLWNIDFEDNYLAGSPDEGGILQIRRLGLPLSHNYINAGICVMNIEKMRGINLEHLYAETLYRYYDLITLQDQDILNIAFVNKIKRLHCRWNVQSRFYKQNELEYAYSDSELNEAALNPGIIHYSDREKPWQPVSRHLLKSLYMYYQGLLDDGWKEQIRNIAVSDFITYDLKGDKVEIFISFKDVTKSFTLSKKFAKPIHKIAKLIFKKFF
ncbi:DUF4422 domain-containing protein [Glaesserella sp.]|uniref:DUF4422 domain-containing protein n=1 Tax=Glaesserella sp. TaxID=2094731 RepID=UPI0035A17475